MFFLQIQSNTRETLTSRAIRDRVVTTQAQIREHFGTGVHWYGAHAAAIARLPSGDNAFYATDTLDRSAASFLRARRRNRDNGMIIGEALASGSPDDMVGMEVDPASMSSRLADFMIDNDLTPCDDCHEIVEQDESYGVGGRTLCQSCLDSGDYVFTEDTNEYMDESEAYTVVNRYGDTEYYASRPDECFSFPDWHPYSGRFFHPDDADSHGLYWSEFSNDWVDEDTYFDEQREDGTLDEVYPYHKHPYRPGSYFLESSTKQDPAIGLEIEVNTGGDIHDAMLSNDLDWILEQDGSLSTGNGVEVISPPIPVSNWPETAKNLSAAFQDADCEGHNAGSGYGIHATIHRRHLTELQEARMSMFFEAECNKHFVDTIAQRKTLYGGYRNETAKPKAGHVRVEKDGSNRKFTALHFKEYLCECRIFRSNIRADRILKNVQFFAALIDWTSRESCTGTGYHWFQFTQWLCAPERAKKYDTLYAYLDAQNASKLGTLPSEPETYKCV